MDNKETVQKLYLLLEEAKHTAGGEIFMDGDGHFFNRRLELFSHGDVLAKVEKLRQAVNRAYDYVSTLKAIEVELPVARQPPHGSRRAVFSHRALRYCSLRTKAWFSSNTL